MSCFTTQGNRALEGFYVVKLSKGPSKQVDLLSIFLDFLLALSMAENAPFDDSLVTEVPKAIEDLTRMICRGFYHPETVIIMDILLKDKCVKETDIVEILQLDPKTVCTQFFEAFFFITLSWQVSTALTALKRDKLAESKPCADPNAPPDASGAPAAPQTYWFINFKHVRL